MNPRDFLHQFDKDFQLESIPESERFVPPSDSNQKDQFSNFSNLDSKKDDFNSNFSFSGLNDSSHFDTPNVGSSNFQFPPYQVDSPINRNPIPNLDDIPNANQYLHPRSPLNVPHPLEEDPKIQSMQEKQIFSPSSQQNDNQYFRNQQQPEPISQQQQSMPTMTRTRPEPKQFSVPSFSYSSVVPSTPQSHISMQPDEISSSPIPPVSIQQTQKQADIPTNDALLKPQNTSNFSDLSTNNQPSSYISSSKRSSFQSSPETINMLKTIQDLKRERVKDAEKLKNLMTENARLQAKLTMLEHTDVKVAELGSKVEQLLQDYLENEQVRAQQAALVTQLRQEVIILKSRIQSSQPAQKPRVRFDDL